MIQQYSRSQYTDLRARIFGIFLAFSIKRGEDNRAPGSFFLLSWSSFFLYSDISLAVLTWSSMCRGLRCEALQAHPRAPFTPTTPSLPLLLPHRSAASPVWTLVTGHLAPANLPNPMPCHLVLVVGVDRSDARRDHRPRWLWRRLKCPVLHLG